MHSASKATASPAQNRSVRTLYGDSPEVYGAMNVGVLRETCLRMTSLTTMNDNNSNTRMSSFDARRKIPIELLNKRFNIHLLF